MTVVAGVWIAATFGQVSEVPDDFSLIVWIREASPWLWVPGLNWLTFLVFLLDERFGLAGAGYLVVWSVVGVLARKHTTRVL